MADVSLADFKKQVLIDLRIYAPGESITNAHISYVEEKMNDVFGVLVDDSVIDWVITGDIPENRVSSFREIVKNRVAPQFGKPEDFEKEMYHISMLRRLRDAVAAT